MIDKNSGNVEDVSKQTSQTEQVNFKEEKYKDKKENRKLYKTIRSLKFKIILTKVIIIKILIYSNLNFMKDIHINEF
jgi:hypothetical protein